MCEPNRLDFCLFEFQPFNPCLQTPPSSSRTRRLKLPDADTLEKIQAMSSASEMESGERKRQYAALGRAVKSSMNPALVQKMKICSDAERTLG